MLCSRPNRRETPMIMSLLEKEFDKKVTRRTWNISRIHSLL